MRSFFKSFRINATRVAQPPSTINNGRGPQAPGSPRRAGFARTGVEAPSPAKNALQAFVAQAPGSPRRAGFARVGVEVLLPVLLCLGMHAQTAPAAPAQTPPS